MSVAGILAFMRMAALLVNFLTAFLILPCKRRLRYSICLFLVYTIAVTVLLNLTGAVNNTFIMNLSGLLFLPMVILLYRAQFFQKVFAFFMQYQFTALQISLASALIEMIIGYNNEFAPVSLLVLLVLMFSVYLTIVFLFGRRIFQKLFIQGRTDEWALYSLGAAASFAVIMAVRFYPVSGWLYISFILFILWSFIILCFAIINTHEKSKKGHEAETLALQMSALRNQIEAENKYRSDMDILRHNMRHEMNVIMELFRTGKSNEAGIVYETWLENLSKVVPATLCAEPVLNAVLSSFERRAKDAGIDMLISSQLPDSLTVDAIKLSIVLSNALENALAAAGNVQDSQRFVNVKFIYTGMQLGLEIVNPCTLPVEFDEKGYPITDKPGHGVGVRSIVAFAGKNNCLLDFSYDSSQFTLQLIMRV